MATMKAAVFWGGGAPEVLHIRHVALEGPGPGMVLIRVKAFGLNQAELSLRQTYKPMGPQVRTPGIEAVGEVEYAPGNEFAKGDVVATAMGYLGYQVKGSYAEYISVPAFEVQAIYNLPISWVTLGAMPQMFQTAWGSLFRSLDVKASDHLLVRGGTTSVGLAAIGLAKLNGINVTATTRKYERFDLLYETGASLVLLDCGVLANHAFKFDKVLDLIGTSTLIDSMNCAKEGGTVCAAGMIGGESSFAEFNPMQLIPRGVKLMNYCGTADDFMRMPLQKLVEAVLDKTLYFPIAKTFPLDQIVEAHRYMEANITCGKIVITI